MVDPIPSLPPTPRRPVVDTYHGVEIVDDYQWLEDRGDPEVRAWSDAQNAVARACLDRLPSLPLLRERIEGLLAGSIRYSPDSQAGGLLFAFKYQPPLQQLLLVAIPDADDLSGERIIVDPNALDPSGGTAIDWFAPSLDGSLVAVSLSQGGSEDGTLHIFRTADGSETGDLIPRVQYGTGGGSVAWLAGNDALLYTRYPHEGERPTDELHFHQQVWRHELGSAVDADTYEIGESFPAIAEISLASDTDGRRVFARVAHGDGGDHESWLRGTDGTWRRISLPEDRVVGGMLVGDDLFLRSLAGAPNGTILRIALGDGPGIDGASTSSSTDGAAAGAAARGTAATAASAPGLAEATTVLPESSSSIADWIVAGERLYVVLREGGPSRLHAFDLAGRELGVAAAPPLTAVRSLVRLEGDEALFGRVGYTEPEAFFRWRAAEGEPRATPMRVSSPADLDGIEVVRDEALAADGTRIPITVLRPRGLLLDGKVPTLLYGYGGYGISLEPAFDPVLLAWLEQGAVYAFAHIRGGGEFGDAWHRAGNLTRKQTVFDDFVACARRLIVTGYTAPERLAIMGASNGGLLMGAVLTQHPDLFRAAAVNVGVLDSIRVERDANGAFNVTEFGTVRDPDHFHAIRAYSPYLNVRDDVAYPAVLLTTGANDPRVDPYHSRKMAARLQAATSSGRPVLLRTSDRAGHGMGSALSETVALRADQLAFLFDQLGVEVRPAR